MISEIDYLRRNFGIEEVLFEDSNFLFDREKVLLLCRAIKEKAPGLVWSCPHGLEVSKLDDELLRVMAYSGCDTVYLAVETPHNGKSLKFQP